MKKLFSLTLALIMVLTLSIAVFAKDSQDASFYLKYKLENDNTSNPAEAFTFTFINGTVTDAAAGVVAPEIPDATVPFGASAATPTGLQQQVQVALSRVTWPSVGIYTYDVKQVAGTTAGVTYSNVTARLKVTVARDETISDESANKYYVAFVSLALDEDGNGIPGQKTAEFVNTYSAGSLDVKKVVTGNLGDQTKDFNVTVTFTAPAGLSVNSEIKYTDDGEEKTIVPSKWNGAEGASKTASVVIDLKHNETVTFTNIPYGVTYTVVEDDYTSEAMGKYDEADYTFSDPDKEIDSSSDTVTITNTKESPVDTGIVLDSLPYVLLIAIAVVGVVIFTSRKRSHREY